MKIKTNIVINQLSGKPFVQTDGDSSTDLTLGIALSNILSYSKLGGLMKTTTLANKFYNNKEVEVDSADLKLIKDCVEASEVYSNRFILGSIAHILEEVKEEKEEKKK